MLLAPLLLVASSFVFGPETPIEPPGVDSYPNNGTPAVAPAGAGFLATWATKPIAPEPAVGIYAMPFDVNAQPLLPAQQQIATAAAPPGIASSPDDSLIAWAGGGGVKAAHVSHLGKPLTYVTLAPTKPGYSAAGGSTRVAWTGARYVVASTEYEQATRFGPITMHVVAVVEGGGPIDLGIGSVAGITVVSGRTLVLILQGDKLLGRYLDADAPYVIEDNIDPSDPTVATNDGVTATVRGGSVIEATTSTGFHHILSLVPQQQLMPLLNERNLFYVQTPENTRDALHVAAGGILSNDVIAFDANDSAIAVREGDRVMAGRGDAWRFTAQADGRLVAVASAGDVDLVVWQRGTVLFASLGDGEIQLTRDAGSPRLLQATWNGSAFVVVWQDDTMLKRVRVQLDGTHSDEEIVRTLPYGGSLADISGDHIAWTNNADELYVDDAFIGHFAQITRVQFVDDHLFWTSRFDLSPTTYHLRLGGVPEVVVTGLDPVFNRSVMAYSKFVDGAWRVVYRTWTQVTRRRAI